MPDAWTRSTPTISVATSDLSVGADRLVRLLQGIAVAANESHAVDEAIQAALDQVCAYVGWPVGYAHIGGAAGARAGAHLWHIDEMERAGRFAALRDVAGRDRAEPDAGLVEAVMRSGRSQWVSDTRAEPSLFHWRGSDLGVRAAFAFPVVVAGEPVGALEFFCDRVVPPDDALLDVLPQVGVQLGHVVERARARDALARSEARFAGIVALASDAIISVDATQHITLFNQGAENIFGYTAAEVIGQPLDVLLPERFRSAHRERHVPAFAASPVASRRMGERAEVFGRRKNGEEFPAEASISKLELGGEIVFTTVFRDISARKRVEQALAKQADELERSNEELAQFAYVASHDLQEPLRMVTSFTQLLARRYADALDADANEFINYAVDGVRRMQALISDLLALSRVGTHGRPFAPTDVDAVLRRVQRSLEGAIAETHGVVTSDALPAGVWADGGQLEQVFQNLVANALKFHGEQPSSVHVSATQGDNAWVFAVRDNGIGIDMEYAERIFVIFQRLHSRADYPGTGIGLAICKKIVERHGGRIWVESAPGRGSTFYFSIPNGP